MAAIFLDLEVEGVDDAIDAGVGVLLLQPHGGVLAVKQRELQHLLDLEAQSLGLVVDDGRDMLEHLGALAHTVVVEHLGRDRD